MADSPNTPNPSAIPQSPSRRHLLAAGAAAIGGAAVAVPVALAGTPAGKVDALWVEFASLGPKIAAVKERIASATEAMPAWAAPGQKYIKADGAGHGDIVDDPMDLTVTPPEHEALFRNVRMSPADARRDYKRAQTMGFPAPKANYVTRLRKLARLRMDQKIERKKVGLPELEAERGALVDRRYDAAVAILNVEETSANAVAAKIIVGALFTEGVISRPEVTTADLGDLTSALTALQPSLTGKIATDVADLLKWGDDA